MTVCVAVRTHDALVFAADSASTLEIRQGAQSAVANVYAHGNKIFNLYKGLPISAMTCGMGHIGERAISTLAKDIRLRLTRGEPDWRVDPYSYSIEEIAAKCKRFLYDERFCALIPTPATPHHFEFWVGGYSSDSEVHDLWQLTIQNGSCRLEQLDKEGHCGIRWGGQPEAITRLIKGFSPGLGKALQGYGVPKSDAEKIDIFAKTRFEVPLVQPSMPIQDSIDLAEYLVETTKGYFRFKSGADTVGGDTEITAVTKHEGFKWVKRKHYYPATLNPLETDHVGHAKQRQEAGHDTDRSVQRSRVSDFRLSRDEIWKRRRKLDKPDRPRRR